MDWIELNSINVLEQIKKESVQNPAVIFKHSTRCSISAAALSRLERSWKKDEVGDVKFYYLDVISNKPVSLKAEELFGVNHESPQVLIIHQEKCIYNSSHMGITYPEIKNQISKTVIKN